MALSIFEELKRRNVFKATTAYLVLAWVVIQVTAEAVPALSLPEWVNTLVFFMGVMGLPFVILFSWAFELTPDGIKKEADVDRSDSIASNTGQKLNYVIILLLVVAIGLVLFGKNTAYNSQPSQLASEPTSQTSATNDNIASIAVLPFLNMSNDADQEFFSDGITEELLNVLAKIPKFEVASRTSSFKYKNTQETIPGIAKDLNVRYVVEGSVRKAGKTIRITAQLIDSSNDRHLWSDTFDRPLTADNIFVIQDEISQNIVAALSKELGLDEVIQVQTTHTTDNLNAYELFLKARTIQATRSRLDEVTVLLDEALEQDPEYADALALAAVNYGLMANYGTQLPFTADELREKSNEYAHRAIELDKNSANAYAVLGLNLHLGDREVKAPQWAKIFSYYEKAIALNPKNPQALNWLSIGQMTLGYFDYSRELLNQCITAEPSYSSCHVNLIVLESSAGNDQLAVDLFENILNKGGLNALTAAPVHSYARLDMAIPFKTFANMDNQFKGWPYHEQLFQAHKNPQMEYSDLLSKALEYLEGINEAEETASSNVTRSRVILLLPLGYHETFINQYNWDPAYIKFRQSPLFKDTMKQLGALKHWQEVGFPKQCRPVGDDDFVCD